MAETERYVEGAATGSAGKVDWSKTVKDTDTMLYRLHLTL